MRDETGHVYRGRKGRVKETVTECLRIILAFSGIEGEIIDFSLS
jgi:hypothetical protein